MKFIRLLGTIKALVFTAIFIFVLVFGFRNFLHYYDPLASCYIKIEKDILRGDRTTIQKALSLIKNTDADGYARVCKYVDTISEKFCYNADAHVSSEGLDRDHPGCYIRGSQIIYLRPSNLDSEENVAQRAALILQLASYSEEFWTQ